MPIAKSEPNDTNSMNVSTQVSNPLEAKNDTVRIFAYIEQVRIHDTFSRERWAGALLEVRSLFRLNSAFKKSSLKASNGLRFNRGRSPVECKDIPSVRPSVRPSIRSPLGPLGHPARPEAQPARPEAQPAIPEA